jgi:hypothetical protein
VVGKWASEQAIGCPDHLIRCLFSSKWIGAAAATASASWQSSTGRNVFASLARDQDRYPGDSCSQIVSMFLGAIYRLFERIIGNQEVAITIARTPKNAINKPAPTQSRRQPLALNARFYIEEITVNIGINLGKGVCLSKGLVY